MFSFNSCSVSFGAYIRNYSNEIAIIDVYLLSKAHMKTLPNMVKVANKNLQFKSGFRNKLDSTSYVRWLDTSHFTFNIYPNTTVDLTDMVGIFLNSHPRHNVVASVTTKNKVDTILNGRFEFPRDKFGLKNVGISSPLFYYDIK